MWIDSGTALQRQQRRTNETMWAATSECLHYGLHGIIPFFHPIFISHELCPVSTTSCLTLMGPDYGQSLIDSKPCSLRSNRLFYF